MIVGFLARCVIFKYQKVVQWPVLFTIVIYDHNDSGQYYKTTILIGSYAPNLAWPLASVINYDHKWRNNLEHHLQTILEESFTIVIQATGLCHPDAIL